MHSYVYIITHSHHKSSIFAFHFNVMLVSVPPRANHLSASPTSRRSPGLGDSMASSGSSRSSTSTTSRADTEPSSSRSNMSGVPGVAPHWPVPGITRNPPVLQYSRHCTKFGCWYWRCSLTTKAKSNCMLYLWRSFFQDFFSRGRDVQTTSWKEHIRYFV